MMAHILIFSIRLPLVDFVIRDAKGSHPKALSLIAKSDTAEVALRRLASYGA